MQELATKFLDIDENFDTLTVVVKDNKPEWIPDQVAHLLSLVERSFSKMLVCSNPRTQAEVEKLNQLNWVLERLGVLLVPNVVAVFSQSFVLVQMAEVLPKVVVQQAEQRNGNPVHVTRLDNVTKGEAGGGVVVGRNGDRGDVGVARGTREVGVSDEALDSHHKGNSTNNTWLTSLLVANKITVSNLGTCPTV